MIYTDGAYPVTEVPIEKLFVAYRIEYNDGAVPEGDDVKDYMIGLWFQEDNQGELTAYQPVPCTEVTSDV